MKAKIVTLKDLEADRREELVLLQTEMTFMGRRIFLKSRDNNTCDMLAIKEFEHRMKHALHSS